MNIPAKRFLMLRDFLQDHNNKKRSLFLLELTDVVRASGATQEGYQELRSYYYERTLDKEQLEKRKVRAFDVGNKDQANIVNAMLDHATILKAKAEGFHG